VILLLRSSAYVINHQKLYVREQYTEGCDVLRVLVIIILHPARSQRPSAIYFDLYSLRKRVTAYGKKMRCSSILLLLSTNQYAAVSRVNGKWQYYKSVQLFSPILLAKKEKYPVRIFKKRERKTLTRDITPNT